MSGGTNVAAADEDKDKDSLVSHPLSHPLHSSALYTSSARGDEHLRRGKFLCVVPPKTLRVNKAGQALRVSSNALDEALEALEFQRSSKTVDGGAVAISVGPAIQAFTDNEIIVSFCGHLTNVDYLAWRLFSPEGRRGDRIMQSPLEAASKLVGGRCYEAELICHMYKMFNTKCLPKLRGKFSFSCFDARSVRVFAARDPSGTYPLLYGRDSDGTVLVANFDSAKEMLNGGAEGPKLDAVPAGCFIYGHRNISPQRYAKDEAVSLKEAAAATDAAANALRGLTVGRKSMDGGSRKSLDGGSRKSIDGGSKKSIDGGSRRRSIDTDDAGGSRRTSGEWSRQSTGNSRLPWRASRDSGMLPENGALPPLSAAAKPWTGSSLYATTRAGSEPSDGERDSDISSQDGSSVLEWLDTGPEVDTAGETGPVLEMGTAEEHRQAEAVAVKAAAAALHRIASGANMKGMVRMGSSNALQALGMSASSATAEPPQSIHISNTINRGEFTTEEPEMAIHRVPSRSGLISSMVKVASFGNLAMMKSVGSLSDLHHAGAPGSRNELKDDAEENGRKMNKGDKNSTSWADLSLVVISNTNNNV